MLPRLQLIALFVLVAVGTVVVYFAWTLPVASLAGNRETRADSVLESLGKPMDERFALVDHFGRQVGPGTFAGKVRLVFFGFTHCPDVCPTGLSLISLLLEELGPAAKDVQALFVTVDPDRDTAAVLKEYVSVFGGGILGLTGTSQKIEAVTKAFSAYFKKVPQPSGDYTVDHTASVYLLDRDGSFRATIDIHEKQDVALRKIRRVLASRS